MSEEEEQEFDPESLDFLLQPKLIEKFTEMFESRISALHEEKEKIETARKNIEEHTNMLENKLETLKQYSKFLDSKGFAYCKQEADEFFKNMAAANTNRLADTPPKHEGYGPTEISPGDIPGPTAFEKEYECKFSSPKTDNPFCGKPLKSIDGNNRPVNLNCGRLIGHDGDCSIF